MKWVGCGLLVFALALPALLGQEKSKDEKKDASIKDKDEKKALSAKEQYDALVKDYGNQQREIIAEARKAKGPEQQKLFEKYTGLGKEFAEKFYKLAEENAKDPVATDALFWIAQNAAGSPVHQKAADKVTALVAEMPLKDLSARLSRMRGNPELLDAVLKRSEKDEKDPAAGDLVAWAATNGYYLPAGQKAIDRLIEKYPDHPMIERVCMILVQSGAPDADKTLKQILEKSDKPKVKGAATFALGRSLAAKTDDLAEKPAEADKIAAEAEKYLTAAIDLYKDNEEQKKSVERELNALRTTRVGKEAPEIKAPDLDGKDFKLSDYRGKVVLLDFWGHW